MVKYARIPATIKFHWPGSVRGTGTECRRMPMPTDQIRSAPKRAARACSGSPCDRAEGSTPSSATNQHLRKQG